MKTGLAKIDGVAAVCSLLAGLLCSGAGPAAAEPASTAAAPQGRSPTVTMADLCGTCEVQKFVHCGDFLEGPAFDDSGNLYVVGINSGYIEKVTPDAKCSHFANTGGQPQGLKLHDGKLYGVDRKKGVFTVDLRTGKVSEYVQYYDNQNFKGPNDLIVDETGGIYFTDLWGTSPLNQHGAVYYISPPPQKRITRLIDNMAFPNGIALSPDNKTLYIDDFSNQRVIAVPILAPGDLEIGFAHVMAYVDGGWGVDSMCVDAKGDVYAAHYMAGEVVVLDPNGFIIGTIKIAPKGGLETTNCAFHGGYLYITEAAQNDVWRVKMNVAGAKLN